MRYWKCVESKREDWFTVGKIYRSEDDRNGVIDDQKDVRGDGVFSNTLYKFTEVTEQDYIKQEEGEDKMEDLRELIKPCYVVKLRGENEWCLAMNRRDGTIGFNSINNIGRGITRMSSLDKNLLDDSKMSEYDIMEIRGYADVNQFEIETRPLIWKRTEKSPAQIKLEELEKKQREIVDEMEKLRKEL